MLEVNQIQLEFLEETQHMCLTCRLHNRNVFQNWVLSLQIRQGSMKVQPQSLPFRFLYSWNAMMLQQPHHATTCKRSLFFWVNIMDFDCGHWTSWENLLCSFITNNSRLGGMYASRNRIHHWRRGRQRCSRYSCRLRQRNRLPVNLIKHLLRTTHHECLPDEHLCS